MPPSKSKNTNASLGGDERSRPASAVASISPADPSTTSLTGTSSEADGAANGSSSAGPMKVSVSTMSAAASAAAKRFRKDCCKDSFFGRECKCGSIDEAKKGDLNGSKMKEESVEGRKHPAKPAAAAAGFGAGYAMPVTKKTTTETMALVGPLPSGRVAMGRGMRAAARTCRRKNFDEVETLTYTARSEKMQVGTSSLLRDLDRESIQLATSANTVCKICLHPLIDDGTSASSSTSSCLHSVTSAVGTSESSSGAISLWVCGHQFHRDCILTAFDHSQKCPECRQDLSGGNIQGNMPSGTMSVAVDPLLKCDGYEDYGSIVITYRLPSGIQRRHHPNPGQRYNGTVRVAYLPDNKEGKDLLQRLKSAFMSGLTFVVGTSLTTGQENCITWGSVHHKTAPTGGSARHGYPDAEYMTRCAEELDSLDVPPTDACMDIIGTMQPSEPSETLAALPPFSPVPLVSGTVAKPPTSDSSVPDEQQFLFHLLHAKACVHTCTVTMCKESKKLLQHVDSCQDQSCRFRDCYKAKMALLHYQRCSTGIGCKECGTVRTVASDAAKRGADFATMTLYDLTRTYRYNLQVSTWAPQRQLRRQSLDLSSVHFFYEKNIESIFIVKVGINDPLSLLSQQLVRPEFSKFVAKNGINECSVQINHHLNQDSPIYQNFIREGRACCTANGTKQDMSVCIVFHGTPEENVEGIMQHGLNPAFRNRQAFGSGEYFAPDPSYPLSYCNGGRKIIVFAVLANAVNIKANQIVVVESINRQLPIAVLSFDYVNINRRAWMAAGQFQGLLSQLQKEKEEKEQVAKLAKQKSRIIQLLIQGERLAASELYEKACVVGIPPPAWSKELSVYVHDHIRDDELVHALFPNLPPRPAESASTLDVLNVDKCEAEAKTATQKYEAAKYGSSRK